MTDLEVVTLGELLGVVEPFVLSTTLETAALLQKSIGGAEVNFALTLARLGHGVGWVGAVGGDPFGREGLRLLRGEGVDVSRAVVNPSAPTGLYFKELSPLGRLRNYSYRTGSAASLVTRDTFDIDYLLSGRLLHLTGITGAISTAGSELVTHLAAEARHRGVHLSVDVNVRHRLLRHRDPVEVLAPLVHAADTLFLSRSEAALLLSDDPVRVQNELPSLAATTVVVHDASGAFAVTEHQVVRIAARRVSVVDPTGAGDAFAAGYLSGWLEQADIDECLGRAEHCAAYTLASRGDNAIGVTRPARPSSLSGEVDAR